MILTSCRSSCLALDRLHWQQIDKAARRRARSTSPQILAPEIFRWDLIHPHDSGKVGTHLRIGTFRDELCGGLGTLLLPFDGEADGRIVQPAHPSADLPQPEANGLVMSLPCHTPRPMPTELLNVETAALSPGNGARSTRGRGETAAAQSACPPGSGRMWIMSVDTAPLMSDAKCLGQGVVN
jgi:hypothetical protein